MCWATSGLLLGLPGPSGTHAEVGDVPLGEKASRGDGCPLSGGLLFGVIVILVVAVALEAHTC